MIQDRRRDNKIALKFNAHDNTCKIYSDKNLNIKSFGLLLGFPLSYTVTQKVWRTSLNAVDINLRLKYVTLSCDSINLARGFGRQGRRSQTLFTFPIFGSTTPMNNGIFNSFTFTIDSNIDDDDIGVDIYFEAIVKE